MGDKPCNSKQLSAFQLLVQPAKKKLVISDANTPKATPSKVKTSKKGHKMIGNTNVNVYVQALNRSKSK